MIETEDDINCTTVRELRLKTGLSVAKFWAPVGVTQSAGFKMESEKDPAPVQKPYRRLIFLHYVAGINVVSNTKEAGDRLKELGKKQDVIMSELSAQRASVAIGVAKEILSDAQVVLNDISSNL